VDRTERFYRIQRMLRTRRFVPIADFLKDLEVSRATFKRDIEYMRDRLNAPIEWDRDSGGYRFTDGAVERELPGLWLSPREIHALLVTRSERAMASSAELASRPAGETRIAAPLPKLP